MSRRCTVNIGNANSLEPIYLKFLPSEVAPKDKWQTKNNYAETARAEIPLAAKLKKYSKRY